jgi:hypothetical protein
MNKEFCTYEQALALKELGFDEPCLAYYNKKELFSFTQICNEPLEGHYIKMSNRLCTPIYQQAFRWFREKYVLLGFIEPANGYEDKSLFAFYICDDEQNIVDDSHSYSKDSSLHFRTYEEAEQACLDKLIEIVKTK